MGGSSGGGRAAPRPQPKARPAPKITSTKSKSSGPAAPRTYIDSGTAQKSQKPSMAPDGSSTSFISAMVGQQPGEGVETSFVPGQGEGGEGLENVFGGGAGQFFGTNPFNRGAADRSGFLGSRFDAGENTVGLDAAVENQPNAPAVGGGEVGVGNQSFGSRVLIGGEGEIITPEGTGSNAIDTSMPAEQAPSDIQQDPNYIIPGPGQAYINDASFSMPLAGNQNINAFVQNSRQAAQRARGPISRGLMSARTGFGKKMG